MAQRPPAERSTARQTMHQCRRRSSAGWRAAATAGWRRPGATVARRQPRQLATKETWAGAALAAAGGPSPRPRLQGANDLGVKNPHGTQPPPPPLANALFPLLPRARFSHYFSTTQPSSEQGRRYEKPTHLFTTLAPSAFSSTASLNKISPNEVYANHSNQFLHPFSRSPTHIHR